MARNASSSSNAAQISNSVGGDGQSKSKTLETPTAFSWSMAAASSDLREAGSCFAGRIVRKASSV